MPTAGFGHGAFVATTSKVWTVSVDTVTVVKVVVGTVVVVVV